MIPPSSTPVAVDRCPGLLRPHLAVDGAVVRIRLPGGRISGAALAGLGAAADTFADGHLQLTSRANLQLRGVPVDEAGEVPDALVDAVRSAGLLPSDSAELIRNIVCSPLTGRIGGLADLRPVVEQLDQLLRETPALTALSGRFLFGLDDGRGDIVGTGSDVGVLAVSASSVALVAGGYRGPVVGLEDAAARVVDLALRFLDRRAAAPESWHVAELPGGGEALLAAVSGTLADAAAPAVPSAGQAPRYGAHQQSDGRSALSLVVPLGRLTQAQVGAVVQAAAYGSGELIVTPWHGLVVSDLPMAPSSAEVTALAASLTAAGLPSTADSGWIGVTACTGAPGCGRAGGATAPVAARIAASVNAHPVHVVACERRCGAPAVAHREVLVDSTGERSSHRPALSLRTDDGRARRRRATPAAPFVSATAPENR